MPTECRQRSVELSSATRRQLAGVRGADTQPVRQEPARAPGALGALAGGARRSVQPAPHRDQPTGAVQALATPGDARDPRQGSRARLARRAARRHPLRPARPERTGHSPRPARPERTGHSPRPARPRAHGIHRGSRASGSGAAGASAPVTRPLQGLSRRLSGQRSPAPAPHRCGSSAVCLPPCTSRRVTAR